MFQTDDQVWFDSERKLLQICNDARAESEQGTVVLVLSHFPSSLTKLTALMREASVPHQNFSTYDSSLLCSATPGTLWTGLARAFSSPHAPQVTSLGPKLKILVIEHHPRASKDQELMDVSAKLSCQVELCFYFSLDDPLLRHFNGDAIQKLFKTLGIAESESLSHPLITTAIRSAQEKIERQVMKDLQTESIEDWFRYNLRSG